jgi:hypothetical protein
MEIRLFLNEDLEATVRLWEASQLLTPNNDPRRDIVRKLADSP